MVIAKTNDAHQHLKQQFRNRSIMKRYKAIVVGRPQTSDEGDENETTVIRKRIERHPRLIQKMQVVNEKEAECERDKDAITESSVLDS
ncbi:Pseudouridine synthase [Balamuthia mandrillaris]